MFILKRLHLEDFMIVEEADFTFEDNQTTAITGTNAVGKSTLLYAIAFCLTGYKKGETYKNYVRTGCSEAKVNLDAIFNDYPIHYETTIGNSVKRTVVYKDITYTNSEYSQFLKEHKLEELCELMFMFQGTSSIIDATARERADKLKKLFKLEFPEIVAELKEKQEVAKATNLQLTAVSSELQAIKSEQLPLLREMTDDYINHCKNKLDDVSNKLELSSNIDASELDKVEQDLTQCQKCIEANSSKVAMYEKGIPADKARLEGIVKYLSTTDIDSLTSSLDRLQSELDSHKVQWIEDSKLYREYQEQLRVFRYKLNELNKQYEVSKTGVCHACGQPIDEDHMQRLEADIALVEGDITECEANIASIDFDPNDHRSKELQSEIDDAKLAIATYKRKLEEKDLVEKSVDDNIIALDNYRNLLNGFTKKKDDLLKTKESLQKIIPLINERESLLVEKSNLESTIKSAEETKIKNSERRETNQKILREKQEREDRIKEMTDNINELSLTLSRLKTEIDIFNVKFPNYITLQMCNRLEDYINSIVQKVFPYCRVALKLENTGLGILYTTESSEDTFIPISMASGCQRQILALAYFIALARMSGVTCIFLDEIDASSAGENAKEIYEFIASLDCFNQMFFISHRPEAYQAVKEHNENLVTYLVENGNYTEL